MDRKLEIMRKKLKKQSEKWVIFLMLRFRTWVRRATSISSPTTDTFFFFFMNIQLCHEKLGALFLSLSYRHIIKMKLYIQTVQRKKQLETANNKPSKTIKENEVFLMVFLHVNNVSLARVLGLKYLLI